MKKKTINMLKEKIAQKYSPDLENVLLILTEFQKNSDENYICEEDMAWVAEYLNITKATVYGVVTYYSMFSTSPRGKFLIRVCCSPVCGMMGSDTVSSSLQSELGTQEGKVTGDGMFSYEKAECLGLCDRAPAMMVNDEVHGNVSRTDIEMIISSAKKKI